MSLKLFNDVNSLFGLFQMEVISFIGMNDFQRKSTLEDFFKSKNLEQLEESCQGVLAIEYQQLVLQSIDHILILKVKDLVVSHAFLTEKEAQDGRRYMEVDILCSRQHTGTGKHMLLACESLALRRGITFTRLSSVFEAMGFYSKMGYSSIPIEAVCGPPQNDMILTIFKQAKQLIGSNSIDQGDIKLPELKTISILSKLRFEKLQLAYLLNYFRNEFIQWESMLENVDVDKHFDDDNLLLMSKCLINSHTIGIFNSGL